MSYARGIMRGSFLLQRITATTLYGAVGVHLRCVQDPALNNSTSHRKNGPRTNLPRTRWTPDKRFRNLWSQIMRCKRQWELNDVRKLVPQLDSKVCQKQNAQRLLPVSQYRQDVIPYACVCLWKISTACSYNAICLLYTSPSPRD